MTERFSIPESSFSSLPPGSVRDLVEELGKMIVNGVYAPGGRIPMEPELVEKFGVSRTVVREAIKVLSGKGLVKTAKRYGSRVCPFEQWDILDREVIGWHESDSPMTLRLYADATEMRCIFEPEAAALAAENATVDQAIDILEAAKNIVPNQENPENMIGADFAFHAGILEASGNIMLRRLRGTILAILQFSHLAGSVSVPDEKVSRQRHVDVAEAILRKDAKEAKNRMSLMLEQNRVVANKMRLAREEILAEQA